MNKTILISILLSSITTLVLGQIKGRVTDQSGEGIPGVNVYLEGTYDGGTTNTEGLFEFQTSESGTKTLVASFIGYKNFSQTIDLTAPPYISIILKEEVNKLSGITITAGSFEASDEKKSVILKPLDIAMTAGATADVPAALNTLPGTTTNGETGRLFVRGGTANETQAFIDGVLVHDFYAASPNNTPSRSRFSPFLFKGTFFSTGGYSAEYGQALSSILSLSSNDLPPETRTDLSFMTVGADVAHTQKWENGSVYGQAQYTNLNPYNKLISQDYDWEDGYSSLNGTFMLRQKMGKKDMLKVYANYDHSDFIATMPNVNDPAGDYLDLANNNTYVNTNYRWAMGKNYTGFGGVSFGQTREDILIDDIAVNSLKKNYHAKTYFTSDISSLSIKAGVELIRTKHDENVLLGSGVDVSSGYENQLAAGFAETDYYVTNSLTLRAGLRYSYYSMFEESSVSPRVSMALKTGAFSQLSGAYGKFHQLPTQDVLLKSNMMSFEQADHYMLSYQSIKLGRTFRVEAYYKDYQNLVTFDPSNEFNPFAYDNSGIGYAQGIDLFWRDSRTIKNGDYWVSYSYIDTERKFRDYPVLATPTFAAKHNASVVYKHFLSKLQTQIGASYSFNSGRPYNNPNEEGFNSGLTKFYSDLSFNFAYLPRQNVILYTSITNLLGRQNVFGYEFTNEPNAAGNYNSMAITAPAKRFFFVGLFITLTKNSNSNNLENL